MDPILDWDFNRLSVFVVDDISRNPGTLGIFPPTCMEKMEAFGLLVDPDSCCCCREFDGQGFLGALACQLNDPSKIVVDSADRTKAVGELA